MAMTPNDVDLRLFRVNNRRSASSRVRALWQASEPRALASHSSGGRSAPAKRERCRPCMPGLKRPAGPGTRIVDEWLSPVPRQPLVNNQCCGDQTGAGREWLPRLRAQSAEESFGRSTLVTTTPSGSSETASIAGVGLHKRAALPGERSWSPQQVRLAGSGTSLATTAADASSLRYPNAPAPPNLSLSPMRVNMAASMSAREARRRRYLPGCRVSWISRPNEVR